MLRPTLLEVCFQLDCMKRADAFPKIEPEEEGTEVNKLCIIAAAIFKNETQFANFFFHVPFDD